MVALLIVLVVVLLSLLITRIATIALSLTGLSREAARFQARSAFSGVGFTTSEAESVVDHPVRRRIVLLLMLLGSAGLVSALASLVVSFGGAETGEVLRRGGVLVAGLALILLLSRSRRVDRRLRALIGRLLRARGLHVRDYATLLDLAGDYAVTEMHVRAGDWMAGRTLRELRLREEGVVVLGVHCASGGYVGVPDRGTRIEPGDNVVLYGRARRVAELDARRRDAAGRTAHEEAKAEQRAEERRERDGGGRASKTAQSPHKAVT